MQWMLPCNLLALKYRTQRPIRAGLGARDREHIARMHGGKLELLARPGAVWKRGLRCRQAEIFGYRKCAADFCEDWITINLHLC